jgi:phosphoribosyl 1,2-cyclic phosphodiesterase
MLIDAGIGTRTVALRMSHAGSSLKDVRAICLTHLDSDHFKFGWGRFVSERNLRVFCHHSRVPQLLQDVPRLRGLVTGFSGAFEPVDGLRAEPISLAHDQLGSHGFVFDSGGCRLGYATDLGVVPDELVERFAGLDLIALESNYDPMMQMASARPWFLKQRIMGGRGHLSNQQALTALRRILDRCEARNLRLPAHIVLLHRSQQCNCPDLVRQLFARDARIAPRLTLAEQYERSPWLTVRPGQVFPGEQMMLPWG